MNADLAKRLIEMQNLDLSVRTRLAADKSLYDGYHPEMQAVHEKNAAALSEIIDKYGWPGVGMVGEKSSEAAWLIAQHAIGLPEFQRECLAHLKAAAEKGEVPKWQQAYMLDRILCFEGSEQLYGTQFDWDENGVLSPKPIEDEKNVDQRRADVGLPPLSEAIQRIRTENKHETKPQDWKQRQKQADQWAKKVGWRK